MENDLKKLIKKTWIETMETWDDSISKVKIIFKLINLYLDLF